MKVSILVAHYNNNQYLKETLESCYNQTYVNWELIIVDDGSITPPSISIIPEKYRDRVILFFHDVNKGVGATFKMCADLATGDLLCMLGAEDTLSIDALELCVEVHKKNENVSLTNSQMYRCDENLSILGLYPYKEVSPKKTYIKNMTIGSLACFKREYYDLTDGFSEYFKKAVDHDLYLKLDEVGALYFINRPLYHYRKNPNGISQGSNSKEALIFSLKARLNAYKRRSRKNIFNYNLNEYKELNFLYFKNKIQYNLEIGQIIKALITLCNLLISDPKKIIVKESYVDFIVYLYQYFNKIDFEKSTKFK